VLAAAPPRGTARAANVAGAADPKAIKLGAARADVTVRLIVPQQGREPFVRAARAGALTASLLIEGVTFDTKPAGVYYLFLNLPPGGTAAADSDLHLAGGLSFFGAGGHGGGGRQGHGQAKGLAFQFDVSRTVRALLLLDRWDWSKVTVSLIPDGRSERRPVVTVKFERVSLFLRR
jgi:hypothetical protein